MNKESDYRRREYFQTFNSPTETLALCSDDTQDTLPSGATEVSARIRIAKLDRRLPLFIVIAFEPDAGNPDLASITTDKTPNLTVADCVLRNHSYVPVVRRVGNALTSINFPSRMGTLGIALEVCSDVDAADIKVNLYQALGNTLNGFNTNVRRPGGRWTVGYSITCSDRLTREEWETAVRSVNMQKDITSNGTGTGTPVLVNSMGGGNDS